VTIFISIASYRDPELIHTINSAIKNALHPENIRFGLVIQDFEAEMPDISNIKNVSVLRLHHREARGAGFARAMAMELYKNEDYYLQVDSHTMFAKNWDELCIQQLEQARSIANNDRVILSYFPAPYYVEGRVRGIVTKSLDDRKTYPTKQKPHLNSRKQWTAKRIELTDQKFLTPEESTTILGGFIFCDGRIVKEVPCDPEISFFGEELCFAVRAWTRGWDLYSPSLNLVYHFYTRGGYKKIWGDRNLRTISWTEIEEISVKKQIKVLCGIEKGPVMNNKIEKARSILKSPSDEDIHRENFLKFLSDSRDWAFSYIENVQEGLNKFVADIDQHIAYYDEYGIVAEGTPHDFAMKKISVAYKELKTLLPEKIND